MPDFKAFDWWNKADWMGWIISGFLVSGGSAFWNHVLDILKATKVQKEQLANSTALAAGSPQIAP
jgi:hypothetical protein